MKKKSLSIKICVCLTAALFVLGLMSVASYFSSSLFVGANQNSTGSMNSNPNYAYLVSIAKSQSKLEAEALAEDKNSCGYIWKEGEYHHVIYSACEQENDATLVKTMLEKNGQTAEIIKLHFPQITIDAQLSTSQHGIIIEAAASFISTFKVVSDISVGLETNVYSAASAGEKLGKLKEKCEKLQSNYRDSFNDFENKKIIALGEYVADLLESVSLTENTIESTKYHAIEILDIYKNMTAELK